jgi:hypothetical protein
MKSGYSALFDADSTILIEKMYGTATMLCCKDSKAVLNYK